MPFQYIPWIINSGQTGADTTERFNVVILLCLLLYCIKMGFGIWQFHTLCVYSDRVAPSLEAARGMFAVASEAGAVATGT